MARYVFRNFWKRALVFFFDLLGSILTFWIPKNQPIESQHLKKILVTRIDHLGDALLLRPALFRLHKAKPDFQIHLLTTPENYPIFLNDSFFERIISFPDHWFQKRASFFQQWASFWRMVSLLRHEHYDMAIDFRGDLRMNTLFFFAKIPVRMGYGITGGGWMLTHQKKLNLTEHQVKANISMLNEWIHFDEGVKNPGVNYPAMIVSKLKPKIAAIAWPYGVIHTGAGNPLKEWPIENFTALMTKLLQSKLVKSLVLIGTAAEKEQKPIDAKPNILDLRGVTDLQELACLLDGAAFFVGNDSGPAHLAAAQGVPVIIFASQTNDIKVWHPWTKKLAILSATKEKVVPVDKAEAAIFSILSQN